MLEYLRFYLLTISPPKPLCQVRAGYGILKLVMKVITLNMGGLISKLSRQSTKRWVICNLSNSPSSSGGDFSLLT